MNRILRGWCLLNFDISAVVQEDRSKIDKKSRGMETQLLCQNSQTQRNPFIGQLGTLGWFGCTGTL